MADKFVIHLIGQSCSGKSSVEKILQEKLHGIYSVSFDKQKWLLTGYSRDTDVALIKKVCSGLFETVCRLGPSVILLVPLSTPAEYESYKKAAETHGYVFSSFELTAPDEVLLARFRQRLESFKQSGGKMSVTTEAVFKENMAKKFFVPEAILSFDTSVMSSEEITKKIIGQVS